MCLRKRCAMCTAPAGPRQEAARVAIITRPSEVCQKSWIETIVPCDGPSPFARLRVRVKAKACEWIENELEPRGCVSNAHGAGVLEGPAEGRGTRCVRGAGRGTELELEFADLDARIPSGYDLLKKKRDALKQRFFTLCREILDVRWFAGLGWS